MRIRVAIVTAIGLAGIGISQSQRSVWDGVYTSDQAKRGQARYAELCASCHGDMLEGGEQSPPLAAGPSFATWNTLTRGALSDRARSPMPRVSKFARKAPP